MNAFLWTIIAWFAIESVCRLVVLTLNIDVPRRRGPIAVDVVLMVCMIVWAVTLL